MGYSKDKHRDYMRDYARRRRQKALDYLGGVCVRCGTTSNLEIDHVERKNKVYEIRELLYKPWKKQLPELDKCQILCATHHREKTSQENRGFTHGTMYGWMKVKCECSECLTAKRTWYDMRNAKRRKGARGETGETHPA